MSRVKVPLMAYPGRECAPEYAEFRILAQDLAYRFALPTRRDGIRQRLRQDRDSYQQQAAA